jgi:predicted transcriptional regulator
MHKKIPKICTGCRVSEAKIYLYHSTEIAKARPHSKEWQKDTSVQKQWSMPEGSIQNETEKYVYLLFRRFRDFIKKLGQGHNCQVKTVAFIAGKKIQQSKKIYLFFH